VAGRAGHQHRRWRISGKKAHIDSVRNDINVTPLVDVMLVLLIIFMLMALIMGRGHDVQLPKAKNFSEEEDKLQPVVTVDIKGDLWVEKKNLGPVTEATLKEMENQVKEAWDAPKNPAGVGRVYLKADFNLRYEKVYPVLEYMNKIMQMTSVDLAVAKSSGGGK
jgi:biopolymer transport protein ExbD